MMNEIDRDSWIYQFPGPAIGKVFTGNKELAASYLGIGMSMLFYVKTTMRNGLLGSLSMNRTLPDGTTIHVQSFFGQDRIMIDAPFPQVITEEEEKDLRIKIMVDDHPLGINELYPIDFRVVMEDGLLYYRDSLVWFYNEDDGFWTIRKRAWIPYVNQDGLPDEPTPYYEFWSAAHPMPDPNIPVIVPPGYGHYDTADTVGTPFDESDNFWVVYRAVITTKTNGDVDIVHAQYPNLSVPDMFAELSGKRTINWYMPNDLISVGDYIDYPNIITIVNTTGPGWLYPSNVYFHIVEKTTFAGVYTTRFWLIGGTPGSGDVLTYRAEILDSGESPGSSVRHEAYANWASQFGPYPHPYSNAQVEAVAAYMSSGYYGWNEIMDILGLEHGIPQM